MTRDPRAGSVHVVIDAVGHEQDRSRDDAEKDDQR